MEYLVHASGEISTTQNKIYAVRASSEKAAKEKAKEIFSNEYYITSDNIYVDAKDRTKRAVCSMFLMIVAIGLSIIGWKNGHDTVSIRPDFISCLYAVLIYSAFVLRVKGIARALNSWIDIMLSCLSVLLIASFVQTLLVSNPLGNVEWLDKLGFPTEILDSRVILPVALVMSWAGLKLLSVISIVSLAVLAFSKISSINMAMGNVWGPIYVLSSFFGILLYCSVEPALIEAIPQVKNFVRKSTMYMANDITEAKASVKKLGNAIKTKVDNTVEKSQGEEK